MDIADLKEILRILEEQDITEFELEQDGVKLRVCRVSAAAGRRSAPGLHVRRGGCRPSRHRRSPRPRPPPLRRTPPALAAVRGGSGRERDRGEEPDRRDLLRARRTRTRPPFVSVGDRVKVGQVLCIIEAMKLMNEIEAEMAGEIVKIHPENGQPVQYGDPLFTIRPA